MESGVSNVKMLESCFGAHYKTLNLVLYFKTITCIFGDSLGWRKDGFFFQLDFGNLKFWEGIKFYFISLDFNGSLLKIIKRKAFIQT